MKNDILMNPNFRIIENEEIEIWTRKTPRMGDHIRVNRGLYSHHGIYISNKEVIHFTGKEEDSILDWSKPEVISSHIDYFLKGDILEVKEYTEEELDDLYTVPQIISYARACLGDKGYNLIFNNCEHFANTCTLGRFRSKQVENVFSAIFDRDIKVYGGNNMGILGTIGGAIKGLFGGRSSGGGSRSVSNTTYEPDKVKIAEIEAESKLKLAEMEKEKVELIKNSQIELLEFNTNCQIAIEEAKARSLHTMVQSITNLQTQLNEIAVKRLEVIEHASIPIIKEIETFYGELSEKIKADDEAYSLEKLPKLLNLLEQYDKDSTAYKLYEKRVEKDMEQQAEHYRVQIDSIAKRQDLIIEGFIRSKELVLQQTQDITKELVDSVQMRIEEDKKYSNEHVLKVGGNEKKLLNE